MSVFSFLVNGVVDEEKYNSLPNGKMGLTYEDIYEFHKPMGVFRLELRYGCLSALAALAKNMAVETPELNKILTPTRFQTTLAEIARFYTRDSSTPVSAADAFNFLRLHVYGGEVKSWVAGLVGKEGRFYDGNHKTIGYCAPKELCNATKNDKGFWQKPQFMWNLMKEINSITSQFMDRNPAFVENMCFGIPEDHVYRRKSQAISSILGIMMLYASLVATQGFTLDDIGNAPGVVDIYLRRPEDDTSAALNFVNETIRRVIKEPLFEFVEYPLIDRVVIQSNTGIAGFFRRV